MLARDDKVAHALDEHLAIDFHVAVGGGHRLVFGGGREGNGGQWISGKISFDGLALGIELNAVMRVFVGPNIAVGASAQGDFARHENGGAVGDVEVDRVDANGCGVASAHRHQSKVAFVGKHRFIKAGDRGVDGMSSAGGRLARFGVELGKAQRPVEHRFRSPYVEAWRRGGANSLLSESVAGEGH